MLVSVGLLLFGVRSIMLNLGKVRGWLSTGFALALACCLWAAAAPAQTSDSAPKSTSSKAKSTTAASKKTTSKTAAKKTTSTSTKAHTSGHKTASSAAKSSTAATHASKSKYASSRKGGKKTRGQQKIDSERAQAIQEALIREHYLSGDAAGTWNQASEDAMRRFQADHGWQSKAVPDSRALISLGLGPSHDHLLNPESAMTTGPFPTRSEALTPTSHSADAASSPAVKPTTSDPAATTSVPTTIPANDPPNPQ